MDVRHSHGTLALEESELVVHETGKNPLTRKEWAKETRIPIPDVSTVLVKSRDGRAFAVELSRQSNTDHVRLEGIDSKTALDALLRELATASPATTILLAHPSDGLPDPVHEEAKKAAKQVLDFNAAEQKRREQAATSRPEVKVKIYDKHKDYEGDAKKMARDGWVPEGQTSDRGGASVGGTAAKIILTGGLGAITGFSRKGNKITVTWMKQPPTYVPKPFVDVPEVPLPRVFPPKPYFAATVVGPITPGHEFDAAPGMHTEADDVVSELPLPESKSVASPAGASTAAGRLRELAQLRDEGIISTEEFETKKVSILAEL